MRVLITGITGFIGSEVAKRLVAEKEHDIFGLIRISSNRHSTELIEDIIDNVEIKYGNFTDYAVIKKIVKDVSPNYIVHLGAQTAVRHSYDNPVEFNETNFLGTVNLIHSALEVPDLKKFIFASSMEVYGWQTQRTPFKEDLKLNPESPYAVSKAACEEYIRMAGKANGLPFFISRACNTFGRKNQTGFIVEYLINAMLAGKTVHVGTPDAVRDMMYVDDHVNAYMTAIKSDVVNDIFNFGTSSMTPMSEIVEKLKELTGFSGKIVNSFPPDYPWRPVVSEFLSLNASKAKEKLGWSPKYDLDTGLRKSVEYWKGKVSK